MDGHDEDRPSPSGPTAVPDLIERFRLRREAWIAQADELARLRDEVRGSAEREAMEIVTSARGEVRQVVMEARRELLVLSAQVQAALGEAAARPDPATLLHKVGIEAGEYPAAEAAAQPIDAGFAPETAIEKILSEVQADMTALADEARALPGRAVMASEAGPAALPAAEPERSSGHAAALEASTLPSEKLDPAAEWQPVHPEAITPLSTVPFEEGEPASSEPPAVPEHPVPERVAADAVLPSTDPAPAVSSAPGVPPLRERLDRLTSTPTTTSTPTSNETRRPHDETPAAAPPTDARPAAARRSIGLSEAASKALLGSPLPSESVPVPSGRSLWTFVALFAGIGLVVVMATSWWLGRGDEAPAVDLGAGETPVAELDSPSGGTTAPTVSIAPAASTPAAEPSAPPPPPPGGPRDLWVAGEAVREVWVRTTVDGRADLGRTLAPGETISVSADRSIALRVGDAGALLISVNEGAWRPLGVDGEVLTREFEAGEAETAGAPSTPAPPSPVSEIPASAASASATVPASVPATAERSPTVGTVPLRASASADVRAPSPLPVVAAANLPAENASAGVGTALSAAAADAEAAETAVLAAAERWLEAYHRQDRATMARLSAENLLLADERSADERFPPGLSDVERKLDAVRVQISADMAVLTAVMTERSGSSPTSRVSPVSQIWVLGGEGEWKVRQARFVSEARLNQVLR